MLEIRPLSLEDLNDYYLMNSDKTTANLQGFKEFSNISEAKTCLARVIHFKQEFKIVKDNEFIGTVSIIPLSLDRSISTNAVILGFGLKKEAQGKGIMTRFLKDLIEYIFFLTKYDTIFVGCFPENLRSKKVIEKYFTYLKDETIYFDTLEEYKLTHDYYLRRCDYFHLETEEVYLRRFFLTDLDDYVNLASDKISMNMAGMKECKTLEEAKQSLEALVKDKECYAIVSLEEMKVIGLFKESDLGQFGFLGFMLANKYQHQGIMSGILEELERLRVDKYQMLVFGMFYGNSNCEGLAKKLHYDYVSDLSVNFDSLGLTKEIKLYVKGLIL